MTNTPTPQQIAAEMTRLLADDDTSDLDTIKAQAIQNLTQKRDETMTTPTPKEEGTHEEIWLGGVLKRLTTARHLLDASTKVG